MFKLGKPNANCAETEHLCNISGSVQKNPLLDAHNNTVSTTSTAQSTTTKGLVGAKSQTKDHTMYDYGCQRLSRSCQVSFANTEPVVAPMPTFVSCINLLPDVVLRDEDAIFTLALHVEEVTFRTIISWAFAWDNHLCKLKASLQDPSGFEEFFDDYAPEKAKYDLNYDGLWFERTRHQDQHRETGASPAGGATQPANGLRTSAIGGGDLPDGGMAHNGHDLFVYEDPKPTVEAVEAVDYRENHHKKPMDAYRVLKKFISSEREE